MTDNIVKIAGTNRTARANTTFIPELLETPWSFSHGGVRLWTVPNTLLVDVDPVIGDSTVIVKHDLKVADPAPGKNPNLKLPHFSAFPQDALESVIYCGLFGSVFFVSYWAAGWEMAFTGLAIFLILNLVTAKLKNIALDKKRKARFSKPGQGLLPVHDDLMIIPADKGEKLRVIAEYFKKDDRAWGIIQEKISGNVDILIEWVDAVHELLVMYPSFPVMHMPETVSEAIALK